MSLWNTIEGRQRDFFRALLSAIGYDSNDAYLAVNEFQAYLMQQPLSATTAYFSRVAELVDARSAAAAKPSKLLSLAEDLSRFTLTHFGIEAGGSLLQGSSAQ